LHGKRFKKRSAGRNSFGRINELFERKIKIIGLLKTFFSIIKKQSMKKNLFTAAITMILLTVLFSACKSKKTNTIGRYVPEKATLIFHVNGASLAGKLPWEDMKKNSAFLDMYKDTSINSFAKTIMDNPENSGVNVKGDFVGFSTTDSTSETFTIEGGIVDEAKFKKLLVEANKGATESKKNGYTFSLSDKASIAYNKDRFIATIANEKSSTYFYGIDTMAKIQPTINLNSINENIIELAEDKSMAKNEKFSLLLTEKGDAHFWFNAANANSGFDNKGVNMLTNLNKLTEGSITTGTVSFDNGKINIDAKSYAGKELTDLFKKYNGSSFSKEMVNNIPSKNLAAVFTFNFKPEGIKALLKLLALDGAANIGLAQYGFTLDDFIKANKGDVLVAVTDLKGGENVLDFNSNYIFAASVNDKISFAKLITAGQKAGAPYAQMVPSVSKVNFNISDKYFALSNNADFTKNYLAGNANSNFDFTSKLQDGPIGGFVNLQYIMTNAKPNTTDSVKLQEYNLNAKLWDNIMITGGTFKDDAINQHWEINLMDKNTNSLKQLNNYSNELNLLTKKKNEAAKKRWEDEDVIAPIPPFTTN
jgi:hypothetical protein